MSRLNPERPAILVAGGDVNPELMTIVTRVGIMEASQNLPLLEPCPRVFLQGNA